MSVHAARYAEQVRNGTSDAVLRGSTFYAMVSGSGAPGSGTPYTTYTDRNKTSTARTDGQVTADTNGVLAFFYDGGLIDLYLNGVLFASGVAGVNDAADLGTQGGGTELAAVTITTTGTETVTTSFTDVAGWSVAPVIGSRGIYIDVIGSFGTVAVATLILRLYDVTASAVVCSQTLVTVAGATGLPFVMRARLAPAAGARSYKLQWSVGSGSTTGAFYGTDQAAASGMYVIER